MPRTWVLQYDVIILDGPVFMVSDIESVIFFTDIEIWYPFGDEFVKTGELL